MIHLTKQNVRDFSYNSFIIPPDQITFGTKLFQSNISNDFIAQANQYPSRSHLANPKLYLTKALHETFNSALSTVYSNNYVDSRINIISGLEVSVKDTKFIDNQYLQLVLNPGDLIMDGVLIRISNNVELKLNLPFIDFFTNRKYDCVVVSAQYLYIDSTPIKFVLWLYDSKTGDLFNDANQVWNENTFVYKTISIEIDKSSNPMLYQFYDEFININNREYQSQFYNYYQSMYIRILLEMFGYSYYFLDLPFVPPIPKSVNYSTTGIFL